MLAIAFDLVVKDTSEHHPKGIPAAFAEIGATLADYDFRRVQGSLYVCDNEDMANLFDALDTLSELQWFRSRCAIFPPSASNNGLIYRQVKTVKKDKRASLIFTYALRGAMGAICRR